MDGGLEWRPYVARVPRPKVREFFTRGKVEYELCLEGGLYVIRRTDRRKKAVRVHETARGPRQRTAEAWRRLVSGELS